MAVLRLSARMVDDLDRATAAAGVLPPAWVDLLSKLGAAPGRRMRMCELAEATLLTRGGVTRLATRVEADGLLRREAVEADGRGAYAVLTDAGAAALRRAWPTYQQAVVDRLAAHLTADQAAAAADALRAVLDGNGWAATHSATGPAAHPVTDPAAGPAVGASVTTGRSAPGGSRGPSRPGRC